jgi:4-hydroxybenzoate polyprenyltransferase
MSLKPYLQLVRLPNLFTAAADSLAGWLLTQGTLAQPARWLPLCGASMALYAGGIALNDLFDLEIDRGERPGRPLPSGQVSTRFAAILGGGSLLAGIALAAASGSRAAVMVAAALAVCILAYDAILKHTGLGPFVMGACRGLNLLLGMSLAARLGGPPAWLAAGSLTVFVAGVTWISRSETRPGHLAGPIFGWVLQNVGLLGLLAVALQARHFPAIGTQRPPIVPLEGLLVLLIVAGVVNAATGGAVREPVPARLQQAVKTGVLSLVWLDVGLVAAVRGPLPALAVALLWVPAYLLGKWIYST